MSSCKFNYIEKQFRDKDPKLADKLNNTHLAILQDAIDSNLFRKKNNKLMFSSDGTKKLEAQIKYIESMNSKYDKNILSKTSINSLAINVSALVSQNKVSNPVEYINNLNELYADDKGYVYPEYTEHVRDKISNNPDIWLKSNKHGVYLETEKNQLSDVRESLTESLNRLSQKFGIDWKWDMSMKAKGRFEGNTVYINPSRATLDTPFHEFAHPFILVLKKENKGLYNRLTRAVQKEGKILQRVKDRYPNLSDEELFDEAIAESVGKISETKVYGGLLSNFMDWIKSIISDIFGYEYGSLRDVANMITNETYNKQLEVNSDKALYQIDEEDIELYANQLEGKTTVQKEVAERMISINRELVLDETINKYVTPDGQEFTRVSDELDTFDFYKFNKTVSDENKALALQWGKDVDNIMRNVLLDKEVPSTSFSPDIAEAIYDDFVKIKQEYAAKGAILLPQITFYSRKKGVAGTADIVAIHKDGSIEILDVKTSRYDFYNKPRVIPGKKFADTYDKHSAQLTMYKALSESMGFEGVEKEGLKTIPVKFELSGNEIIGFERPYTYIQHGGVERLYEIYKENFQESQFTDIMGNLKKVIQKKITEAKKSGKTNQVNVLESILEDIRSAIDIEGVNKFINEAFNTFSGNSKFSGFYNIYRDYLDKVQIEEDPLELLAKIHEIEATMELYQDSIKELWEAYLKFKGANPLDNFEANSPLDKLDKLQRMFIDMQSGFKDKIPRVIARILAQQVDSGTINAIKQNIKDKKRKTFEEQDTSNMGFVAKTRYKFKKNQQQKISKRLRELEEQFLNDKGEVDIEEAIYREIKNGGYKDVSLMDRWLSPAVSMPNTFLPTFVLTIKQAFEQVRVKNLRFIPKAYEEFKRFANSNNASKDLPHEFNKGLYTKRAIYRDGKLKHVMTFSSPIEYGQFNIRYEEMLKSTEESKDKNALRRKWFIENTQVRPDKHIDGVTKIGETVLIESKEDIEKRKLEELGEKGFKAWQERNTYEGILMGEYRIPKMDIYKDDSFYKLTGEQKRYYEFLFKTYLESQSKLPPRKEQDKFILPYIDKSTNDRLLQGEYWNTLKYKGQDMFMLLEEDMLKENVERLKTIPVLYYDNYHTMDANDVSVDLLHSVLRFKMAADRYSVQNKYIPLADNLLSLVEKTAPTETDSEGFKLLDKAAKSVGITEGVSKYVKKHGNNNSLAMLEAFIDTQIYGITRKDPKINIGGATIDVGKITDTLMNFASLSQIAFDPLTAAANSLNAQIQVAEEAFAGQFINGKSWREAQAVYNTHEMDFIQDSLSPYNKSFLGTLTDTYDAMQGEYIDHYGRKVSMSALKNRASLGTFGYSLMHKGEHRAAVSMMIALLKSKKVGDKTLYDLHKEEFEKYGTIRLDVSTQNKLHAINKRLHGVYNKFDAPEAQRYALGRLILMYRKFLVPGLKRRFKSEGIDYELGEFTEGMYRTFYKKLFTDTRALFDILQNKQGELTTYEMYNMKRAIMEHLIIAITGLFSWAMLNLGDDDEEKGYIYHAVLYQILRVNAELSVYGGLGDINDYMLPDVNEVITPYKTTSALFTTLTKVTKLYQFAMGDLFLMIQGEDIQRYKRDSGVFEKGDSKTMAALLKLMGISGKNLDTEMALQTLALTKGVDVSK